jgi:hypothetical protein
MPNAIVAAQVLFVHGGFNRDIGGRHFERQVEDLQAEIIGDADLVDRSTAGREVFHHLSRHRGRKRRDALLDHTVIARKDRHQRPRHRGDAAGPGGQPECDFLKPPKRA